MGATLKFVVAAFVSLGLVACQSLPSKPTVDSNESNAEERELIQKGIELHELGEFGMAEQRYRQVLSKNSDNAFAMYELAYALVAQNKIAEAMRWTDKALGYRSSSRAELLILKANLLDGQGKFKQAAELYQQCIDEFPEKDSAYYNYGVALLNQNQFDEAVRVLQQDLQLRPDHIGGHLALGMAYANSNKRTEAILALLRFLTLEPDSARSGAVLDELRGLLIRGISVSKDESGKPKISVGPGAMGGSMSDLSLTLIAAVAALESTETAKHNQLALVVTMLANKTKSPEVDDMVSRHYVSFLQGLVEAKHEQAFLYYIEQSRSEQAKKWLAEHAPEKGVFEVYSRQQFESLRPTN